MSTVTADPPLNAPALAAQTSSLKMRARAMLLALGLCGRIYGLALALVTIAGLAVLLAVREGMDYLAGADASLGHKLVDAVVLRAPLQVSAAACLAPLTVLAGAAWLALNRGSFHATANRAVLFGLRHGGMQTRIDEQLLQQRLGAFATFMRTFTVAMPILAVVLIVIACTLASWGAAGALMPSHIFAADGLRALAHPPGLMDHLVYWMSVLINFVLVEAPETFGWSISPLTLQGDAVLLLVLAWLLGATLVFMVAQYFSFAFNWTKHAQGASLKALVANTDAYVRELWQHEETAEQGAAADGSAAAGATAEQSAPEPPAENYSDEELRAMVPALVKLRINASTGLYGAMIGVAGFLLGLGIVAAVAAVLLVLARLAVPALAAMSFVTAAGLTVVPAYLAIEIIFKLVDRGRLERKLANLYGSFVLASLPEKPQSFEESMMRVLRVDALLTWLRAALASFLGLALVFQCLYVALITAAVLTVWPDLHLFAGSQTLSLGEIALFWLDVPLDVFLLGAPDLFGFGLSTLSYNPDVTWFVVVMFLFKVVLVAEAINLLFAVWNTQADVHSRETHDTLDTLRQRAEASTDAAEA